MEKANFKKNTGFVRLRKVVEDAAKKHHLQPVLIEHQTLRAWEKVVEEFVENASHLTKAVNLKSGILVVACLTQEIAYQIRVLSQRIIEAINKMLGTWAVKAIQVEV